MATEKSCLLVDEDGKDADPEINAISLLQEPLKMAHGSSFTHSFGRDSPKQNSVLDVLSNTDMFSPVGLETGPLHQATQANDINSISTEKEEEKSITPLENVQEIESAEMWDFDEDSPDHLLTNLSSASHLPWDHQQEILEYLIENNRDCPQMESGEELSDSHRRRKRKMDMVVMVDPSENLDSELSQKSSMELSDGEDSRGPRDFSNLSFSPTDKIQKYPNGTVNAIKDIFYNSPTRNSNLNHESHGLSPLKRTIIMNSHSEEKSLFYPCAKCGLSFKKEHHLHSHMKSHPEPKPFICRECGQSFRQSRLLIEHMSTHKAKKRVTKELKDANNKEDKSKKLFCPQCSFVTNCPNTFVQHAKTHDKNQEKTQHAEHMRDTKDTSKEDKTRKFFCPQCSFVTYYPNTFVQHAKTHEKEKKNLINCSKCTFVTLTETDLIKHNVKHHSSLPVQGQKKGSAAFSCNICSYKAFSEHVFRNHLLRRHPQSVEQDISKPPSEKIKVNPNAETFSCNLCLYKTFSEKVFINHILHRHQKTYEEYLTVQEKAETSEARLVPNCKSPSEDAEFTSQISVKNRIPNAAHSSSDSSDLSELLKGSRIERDLKSKTRASKLDRSINVLMSRQKHCRESAHLNQERSSCRATDRDSKNDQEEDHEVSPNGHTLGFEKDGESRLKTEPSPMKKSSSKRKMSTPFHNKCDQDSSITLSNPLLRSREILEEDQMSDDGTFSFKDTNSFDNGLKKEKQNIMCTYSRRMSMRGALQASKRLYDKIKTEGEEQLDPEIKDEPIESEIYQETFDTHQIPLGDSFDESSDLESERKSCPYCPAVFESGVGLSNHVRGHLHRVGLSYKARHVVSPEQVAYEDRKPRGRRKMSSLGRLKKARVKTDSETVNSIHSCPLCGDTFDNRTGQSNHIRGHLKKLGRTLTSKKKTPLMVLRELMRDKKELERALQILGRKRNHFPYSMSPKLSNAGRFTPSPIDAKDCIDAKPLTFSFEGTDSEEMPEDSKLDVKNSLSSATALIGILKKRKCQEETRVKAVYLSKNTITVSSNSDHCSGSGISELPNSLNEKGEFNRKVCVHCNATFHSGVSLSNHLRAYEKRKKNALMEGTTFDCCKARRQRSRPGSKKKTLLLTQTPEEMYRLTCRFCDLVFQGPLSVQEDWIKHLQRHIMNTSVPHTGLGMVEVTPFTKDLQALKDEEGSPTATNAAS